MFPEILAELLLIRDNSLDIHANEIEVNVTRGDILTSPWKQIEFRNITLRANCATQRGTRIEMTCLPEIGFVVK